MENSETEELDFDDYAAEARARMRKVIAGLEEAYAEDHTAQLATAIIKAQERLDYYCGFAGAPRMLTPAEEEEKDKTLLESVADMVSF